MERTSLVTKYELDLETSTRIQSDSWLASFVGKPWTTPNDAMPDYTSNIDIADGASLTAAVGVLDRSKNRKIVIQNALGGVVISNPNVIRFSGLGLSSILDGNGVLVTIAGDVVHKPGTETNLISTVQDQRSLDFTLGQGAGLVTRFFSGGRFAYGMSVSYRQFGSIRATFTVVDRIILHGVQGRISTPGVETTEMRLGTVVKDAGRLFSASIVHTTSMGNRPSNSPRPVEWRASSSTNSGDCLRAWTRGALYNRGLLVLFGNTMYAVLEDNLTADATPPDAPNLYFSINFPNFGNGTYQPGSGLVTDVGPRGMRTLKYTRSVPWTNNGAWTRAPEVVSDIRYFLDVSENLTWSALPAGHVFYLGDIVKPNAVSQNLYINLAATNQRGKNGSNPLTSTSTPLGMRNFVANAVSIATLNRLLIPNDGVNLPVGERIRFFDKTGTSSLINEGVTYYVRSVSGNYITISLTPGGDTIPVSNPGTFTGFNAKVTTLYPWWYQLVGLVPWTSSLQSTDPGVFYCWGGGKIITPRRTGFTGVRTTPSLDDGSWWFINDNYRLNVGSQKTNASGALEWPNVGSNIIVTG